MLYAVIAMACFAVLDTTNKFLLASVPMLMVLWFRYAFQAVATTALPPIGTDLLCNSIASPDKDADSSHRPRLCWECTFNRTAPPQGVRRPL
jgi:hypothetical protein